MVIIRNSNATNAQTAFIASNPSSFLAASGMPVPCTIDTTGDTYVNINGITNGTETLSELDEMVEVIN